MAVGKPVRGESTRRFEGMLDIARQVPPASRNGRIDKKDSNERARTNGPSCIFQQLRFPILEYESCGEF